MWAALVSRELDGTPMRKKYKCKEAMEHCHRIICLYWTLHTKLASDNASLRNWVNVWRACTFLPMPSVVSIDDITNMVTTEYRHYDIYELTGYVDIGKRNVDVMCKTLHGCAPK
jgi:hypothetical protein